MSDVLVKRYIDLWNERDAGKRRAAMAEIWIEEAYYVDPLAEATGHEAVDAVIAGAQAQFPGFVFRLAGEVEAHHNMLRFTWELAPQEGAEAVVVGSDVASTVEGKLQYVVGFLDKVPAQ